MQPSSGGNFIQKFRIIFIDHNETRHTSLEIQHSVKCKSGTKTVEVDTLIFINGKFMLKNERKFDYNRIKESLKAEIKT